MSDHNEKNTIENTVPKTSGFSDSKKVIHNLDTGKDEPMPDRSLEDESAMDFGAGSGGGSAPAGAAS